MNFLNKMERKIGKYAIPNLMIYLIAAYCIGFVIYTVNPNFMLMLTLSPYHSHCIPGSCVLSCIRTFIGTKQRCI